MQRALFAALVILAGLSLPTGARAEPLHFLCEDNSGNRNDLMIDLQSSQASIQGNTAPLSTVTESSIDWNYDLHAVDPVTNAPNQYVFRYYYELDRNTGTLTYWSEGVNVSLRGGPHKSSSICKTARKLL